MILSSAQLYNFWNRKWPAAECGTVAESNEQLLATELATTEPVLAHGPRYVVCQVPWCDYDVDLP